MNRNDTSTNGTEHERPVIEIDAATRARFEEERKKTETEHAPAMGPCMFLNALLDKHDMVRELARQIGRQSDTEGEPDT